MSRLILITAGIAPRKREDFSPRTNVVRNGIRNGCTPSVGKRRNGLAPSHEDTDRGHTFMPGPWRVRELLRRKPAPPPAAAPPTAVAKEKSPPAEPVPGARRAPRKIEESLPSIYYLKDEHGNLQAVPNFTLEDFEELYKLKHQLKQGDPLPRYTLQQMFVSGTINSAGQAELTVQFRIVVLDDQWTRIPLRLDQAVLREPAQYQGPGEHLLSFEGEGEGYVAWLRGPEGQTHQLTLKLLVPLTTTGQETRLRLLAPRTTASELKLKVPYARAVARASEGATLQSPRGGGKETELIAVGLNGDFELSWHPPGYLPGKPASLEAFGNILSRLDGRGVETDATFSVRSYGEAFDHFRIRLPPDSELVPGNGGGYTLTMVDGARAGTGHQRTATDASTCNWRGGPPGRLKFAFPPSARSIPRAASAGWNWPASRFRKRPGNRAYRGERGRRLAGPLGRKPRRAPNRSARIDAAEGRRGGLRLFRAAVLVDGAAGDPADADQRRSGILDLCR